MSLKKIYYLFAILLMGSSLLFVSCNKDKEEEELLGDWFEGSDLNGIARTEAVGFVIGNYGYLATGADENNDRLGDLWAYNSVDGYWEVKASIPVPEAYRSAAVAFAVDGKGYVGTGVDNDANRLNDFWCYSPTDNDWTQLESSFPGSPRYGAVAFAVNGKGYVGTGYDVNGETKDFFEYSPGTDTWVEVSTYPGNKRRDACVFVIESLNKAYLLTGKKSNMYDEELYEFDATTKGWTKKRDIADTDADNDYDDDYTTIVRTDAVAFAINGKGYLATGSNASNVSNVWEYDPAKDLWTEKTNFQAGPRYGAVAFGIGNYGYIATGAASASYVYDDLAVFDPTAEDDEKY